MAATQKLYVAFRLTAVINNSLLLRM